MKTSEAVCHTCGGTGRKPFERDPQGFPVSWVWCDRCKGTGDQVRADLELMLLGLATPSQKRGRP